MAEQSSDATFRFSFYVGLILTFLLGVWLTQLWGTEKQVKLHTEHFLQRIEKRDWAGAGKFLAANYQDEWGDDRELMINRLRLGLRMFSSLTIMAREAQVEMEDSAATWRARIQIAGGGSELAPTAVAEINRLTTPFTFRWEKQSWKPWDWKLSGIHNQELQLPAGID